MADYPYGVTQSQKLPAPELNLEIQAPTEPTVSYKVVCIIDTGACISAMPRSILKAMPLHDYTYCGVSWGSGQPTKQRKCKINLVIGKVLFEDLWVVETEKAYGLLGRDVLNDRRLMCDGPKLSWSVEPQWT